MNTYLFISSLVFLFLSFIWNQNGANPVFKLFLFLLGAFGMLLFFQHTGVINVSIGLN